MTHTKGAPEGRSRASRGKRILRGTAIGTVAVLVLGAGAAYAYKKHLDGNLKAAPLTLGAHKLPPPKKDAQGHSAVNILLIGTDTRATAADCAIGGSCDDSGPGNADVEIVLHISADRSNASMLSIPRDTDTVIPACTAPDGTAYRPLHFIINASLSRGGPGCTQAAVEALTGISITDWMMVDFSGVVNMANAVGGVPVCLSQNVDDSRRSYYAGQWHDDGSHLHLKAGPAVLVKGDQTLQWLRTRHAWAPGGDDLGRAKAQHMYLNSLVRTLRANGTVTDPVGMLNLAETATRNITVSDNIKSVDKLLSLAEQMKSVDNNRITSLTMPNAADPINPGAWLVPTDAARQIFSMIANDIPLDRNAAAAPSATPTPSAVPTPAATTAPADIALTVLNASGGKFDNRAGDLVTALKGLGFTRARTGSSPPAAEAASTLRFPAALQGQAQQVATALHLTAAALKPTAGATGITLRIGTDWPSGSDYGSTLPKSGSVSPDAAAQNAESNSDCMSVRPGYTW